MFSIQPLRMVTTLSKYIALILFIILPFLGGYIGYSYAPEKIVYVASEVPSWLDTFPSNEEIKATTTPQTAAFSATSTLTSFTINTYKCNLLPYAAEESDECYQVTRYLSYDTTETIKKLQWINPDGQEFSLKQLYADNQNNKVYFEAFVPGSSNCCVIVVYDVAMGLFTQTSGYLPFEGESVSPDGRYVLRHYLGFEREDEREVVEIVDSGTDEVLVATMAAVGESFNAGCAHSDGYLEAEWITSREVSYAVYDPTVTSGECGHRLIEKRNLKF